MESRRLAAPTATAWFTSCRRSGVGERQLRFASEAAIRFGKGRHRAALNFGDCFAYALAKSEDIPLLCTGGDFALTDVAIA